MREGFNRAQSQQAIDELNNQLLRMHFEQHLIHQDDDGKTFIDENELFEGEYKLTPTKFNRLVALKPPITVDYIKEQVKEKSLVGKVFAFKLPIGQTLAFWTLLAAGMFYVSSKEHVGQSVAVGSVAWYLLEQIYHRAGHLNVSTEGQMRFIYGLHWQHHLEPDRPGNTVSPIAKNLVLAVVMYFLFYLTKVADPMMTLGILTLQYNFYEFTHWLSHTTTANEVGKWPMVGGMFSNIVGHHREHHRIGDRFAVSSGSLDKKVVKAVETGAQKLSETVMARTQTI